MVDVFISHSSLDKPQLVEPLVQELKAKNVSVWYDKESIIYGENIKNKIMQGIQSSLVFVIILDDSFLKSCWANLELGISLHSGEKILPILYNTEQTIIAEKYPFLMELKCLTVKECEISLIANTIVEMIPLAREDMGFNHYDQADLSKITKRLHSYNNFKLDQIAINMRTIIKEINTDPVIALNTITLILDLIISDICETEHIHLNTDSNKLEVIGKSKILNGNIFEHFRFLYKTKNELLKMFSKSQMLLKKQDVYLVQISIYSILEWYMLNYFKYPIIESRNIIPAPPSSITNDDMNEAYNIETLTLPPELIAGPEMTQTWFLHNNLTLLGSRDKSTGKLVGFIHTLPVTDELFDRISEGNFDDTVIRNDEIRQYDVPGFYKLYLSSICVHPKYNSSTAFKVMYNEFIEMLLALAHDNEIYISDVLADAVTTKGQVLCESVGMKKHCISIHGTPVYKAQLIPPSVTTLKLRNRYGQQLLSYYQRIYDEYKELF